MTSKTLEKPVSLLVRGRNASGKLIEGTVPAGELSQEDPGLTIQRILAKCKDVEPTPIEPE